MILKSCQHQVGNLVLSRRPCPQTWLALLPIPIAEIPERCLILQLVPLVALEISVPVIPTPTTTTPPTTPPTITITTTTTTKTRMMMIICAIKWIN